MKEKDESGVKYGEMTKEINENRETEFPYEKLIETKSEIWENLQSFYGISSDFLS